jgi:hypothetical protein
MTIYNLTFSINWDNINNPYTDTTDYNDDEDSFPPTPILHRQYNSYYSLSDIIKDQIKNHVLSSIDLINLYKNVDKLYKIINLSKNTRQDNNQSNDCLYITQQISQNLLSFIGVFTFQEILDVYIMIYSSIDLFLVKTPEVKSIIQNTLEILINNGANVNIQPLILPLYNGIEHKLINQVINNGVLDTKIYENRAFILNCIISICEHNKNMIGFLLENTLYQVRSILFEYMGFDLLKDIKHSINWHTIDITQPLIYSQNTFEYMRFYIFKKDINYLQF